MTDRNKPVTSVLLSSMHVTGVGGLQVVLRDLANSLEASGRRVCFVKNLPLPGLWLRTIPNVLGRPALACGMPAWIAGGPVISFVVFLAYLPIAFFNLARLIRREKIDVINAHYLEPYFIHLAIAARLLGIPMIVSVHGADIEGYSELPAMERWFCRSAMRLAHRVVACSHALARETMATFSEIEAKVTCVHNGLDPSQYGSRSLSRPLPRRFVLSVCRHVHKKGIDVLLRAFAMVTVNAPDVSLVLVGDGPLLNEHEALARSLGIETHVLFAGNVDHAELKAFFDACTLYVLPSRVEPFGLVVLEAANSGKAMVCTRVGGVPEILTDGADALLVASGDPEEMATKITLLLDNPALAAQLGQRANQTLLTRFLWKDRVLDYLAVYQGRVLPKTESPKTSLSSAAG